VRVLPSTTKALFLLEGRGPLRSCDAVLPGAIVDRANTPTWFKPGGPLAILKIPELCWVTGGLLTKPAQVKNYDTQFFTAAAPQFEPWCSMIAYTF